MIEQLPGMLIDLNGPTCSGKTTFAQELGIRLGAAVFLETTEGNPHMADAHKSGEQSWDNQLWFLHTYVDRLTRATKLIADGKIAVIDGGLETYKIHSKLTLSPEQNIRYAALADELTRGLAHSNLTLLLTDTRDFLMARLKKRGKSYDDASADFITSQVRLYEEWKTHTPVPLIALTSRDLEHEGLKAGIIQTILHALHYASR